MAKPVAAPNIPNQQVVDLKTGRFTETAMRGFQAIFTSINASLNLLGEFIGNISSDAKVGNRSEGLGTTLNHITATGQLDSLTNVAADVDTDHITDGAGSPLSGGIAAHAALVASSPSTGNALIYSLGTGWHPATVAYSTLSGTPIVPNTQSGTANQWLKSYDSSTGNFTETQPDFSNLSGSASTAQLPATVPNVSSGSGAPSSTPADNSIYFDTSATPAHGYVRLSGAWVQFS